VSARAARRDPSASVRPTARSARRSGAGKAAAWALAIALTATFLALLVLGGSSPPAPYFGTRLGLSERALRERFEGADSGRWTASGSPDEVVLRWTRTADRPRLPVAVVFEFNEDKLVAIRADLERTQALALGPAVESSFAAVVGREPQRDGTVRLTVLSRTCSRHVAEAAKLIASGARSAMLSRVADRP
jgi:hypothetical protein